MEPIFGVLTLGNKTMFLFLNLHFSNNNNNIYLFNDALNTFLLTFISALEILLWENPPHKNNTLLTSTDLTSSWCLHHWTRLHPWYWKGPGMTKNSYFFLKRNKTKTSYLPDMVVRETPDHFLAFYIVRTCPLPMGTLTHCHFHP